MAGFWFFKPVVGGIASDIEAAYTVGAVSDSNQSVTKAAAEKGKVTVKKKGVDKTSSSEKKGTKGDTPAKSSTAGESSELQPSP